MVANKIRVIDKIQSIKDERKATQRKRTLCEKFNKRFQLVFTKENHINMREKDCTCIHKQENIDITEEIIEKELKALAKNKASGPDEKSCWVLQECAEKLSVPLKIIFVDFKSREIT